MIDEPAIAKAAFRATQALNGKDNCEVCQGEQGGARGNENRLGPLVVCDYCHIQLTRD